MVLFYYLFTENGELISDGNETSKGENELEIKIPADIDVSKTFHLIVQVQDTGRIPLSKYGHAVLESQ
jgi:hypothetical protein